MTPRAVAAAFNAIVMVALAFQLTGGRFSDEGERLIIWGSALAAVIAAAVVLTNAGAAVGWVAVGYVLFAAFAAQPPTWLLVLLALAFMPLLPPVRGSVLTGIALAVVAAVAIRFGIRLL